MGSSTGVRLVFGMLTFVVMARWLGPESFGTVMLWLSVSTLLSLVANFGLAPYLLKEIGASPQNTQEIMGEVLTAKLLLSAVVLLAGLCILPFIQPSIQCLFLFLLAALLADSLTEFLNIGFRATNRFATETRVATTSSVLQFLIISASLWFDASELMAALGFFCSRFVTLAITWLSQRRYFSDLKPASLVSAAARIRATIAYAVDFGFQSLFGQIDSMVLNYFLGPSAVGLYQAGMRVFTGGAQAATVLANVFLPRSAAAWHEPVRFEKEARLIQKAFIAIGAAFGLVLAIFSEQIEVLLFGHQFEQLGALFPWFGLLFFVRFYASSWGIVLTSAGLQGFRAWMNLAQWIFVLILAWIWVPLFGVTGWLMALVGGNTFLGMAYFIRGSRLVKLGLQATTVSVLGAVSFMPFVHFPIHIFAS
jgi:O-antigen/teichoic acid export membrane protein